MHSIVDLDRVLGAVPAPLVMTLRDIDRGQGSEGLYLNQVPDLLTELANRARTAAVRPPSLPTSPLSCEPGANKNSPATVVPSTTCSPRTGVP